VGEGDLVICRAHCYSDGYWADVARTYHVGVPDREKRRIFEAVFAARDAALAAIQPGVPASRVDATARRSLESRGFEAEFLHPAGHGAGFSAMDYAARPRLHPKSEDVLEPGMVLKLEPGVYVDGIGGVRLADMVAVGNNGPEVLTPFQWDVSQVEISKEEKVNAL
jgi:Xaa-Pro aminopeptidase